MVEKDEIATFVDEKDTRTEPERAADDKIEALETELASLQPGVQIILERLRPSWCKGQLEKITIGEEGLDLDYLIRTWGGHLLSVKIVGPGSRIKGSHSVELYTFEPRRHGKLLRAPNRLDDDEPTGAQPNPVMVHAPPSQEMALLPKMLEMLNGQRQSEVDTLKTILLAQQQIAPAPAPAGFGGVGEIVKMANAFNQLKEMFKGDAVPTGDPESAFPAQVMDMVKVFLDSKQREPQAQLVAPVQQQQLPPRPSVRRPPPPAPLVQDVQKVTPIRGEDLVSQITEMPPDRAAETLITALGQMPPEKQSATLAEFMGRFQDTMPDFFQGPEEYDAADDEEYEDDEQTEGVKEN